MTERENEALSLDEKPITAPFEKEAGNIGLAASLAQAADFNEHLTDFARHLIAHKGPLSAGVIFAAYRNAGNEVAGAHSAEAIRNVETTLSQSGRFRKTGQGHWEHA